ncbi:retrovirus-related pol polyprotein from transposon TNT 1-94 [Tanacetum coccineum]
MTTLADKAILSGADNRPPMLEKDMYDSWKSIMELYMMNRQHGRMILESVENGPLIWPSIEENGVTRPKKYSELSPTEAIQADCDVKATNIILQGLPPEVYALCKLYDEFDKFAYKKGESLRQFYLRFSLLLIDMNIYNMKLEQFQVNTKFLNNLPLEWSKFVTDVKLVRYLHTTNIDQLHAYLGQQEFHANESPQYGSPYQSQQYSTHQSSTPLSITYPSNDYQSSIHHNIYSLSSSIPQLEYPPSVDQQSEFSQQESGLIVPVFQKGDDLIDAINHMMSFLTAVGRQTSVAAGTSRTYTPGASGNNSGKQRTFKDKVLLVQAQASGQILHEEELAVLADPGIPEVALMANLSHYGLDALSKVHNHDNVNNDMTNQVVQAMPSFEQLNVYLIESHRVDAKLIAENEHLKQTYKQLYDSIKPARVRSKEQCADLTNQVNRKSVEISDLNACLQEKVLVITTLKDELRKLKGKDLANNEVTHHPSDPEINTEPITPKLLNKRSAHTAYIKHTQEEAAVLRDLVDHIHANYPLDPTLESACKYTKLIQELLTKISKTCPSLNNSGEQLVAVTPMNKVKRVRFTEPVTSSRNTITKKASTSNLASNKPMLSSTGVKPSTSASGPQPSGNTKKDRILQTQSSTQKNKVEVHPRKVKSSLKNKDHVVAPKGTAHVQHSKLNANSELKCVKCNGCMLSDNHDLCVLDYINNVNARAKSKSAKKQRKRKVWKPTGKMFTTIGYIWRPTGQTFTIVGNACPLTRITTTTEAPLRKPVVLDNETSKPAVTLVYSRKPKNSKTNVPVSKSKVLQSVSANKKEPSKSWGSIISDVPSSSFNECKSSKLSSGMLQSRVYYVEGLGHNLFSVGKFCDSNLEVAFRQHTCFIRNLEGVDLLNGSRGNNLYTLSLGDMMASSLICLLSNASKTKSWLWHRRLSHLNFGAINHLARHGLVLGLPKLKFEKDHLCKACAIDKSKKKPHKPKFEYTNHEKLYLLHMDLCRPIHVESVNGKKSKDEAPDFIIKFLKMIQLRLKVPVRRIRTDNGTEFVNQTLREYYEKSGISHKTSVARSLQQNGVVERRNRSLIEAARTMLIYAKAPLFIWAEALATTCYTQNRSIICLRHGKIPYELLHDKLPDLSFFYVFGALYYLTNDSENLASYNQRLILVFSLVMHPRRKHFEFTTDVPDESLRQFIVDHPAPEVVALIDEVAAPEPAVSTGSPSSTIVDQDALSPIAHMGNDPYFGIPIPEVPSNQSSSSDSIHTNVPPDHQISEHNNKWTKDHPLENIIGELARPFHKSCTHMSEHFLLLRCFLTAVEPKTYKDALTQAWWIKAMQE